MTECISKLPCPNSPNFKAPPFRKLFSREAERKAGRRKERGSGGRAEPFSFQRRESHERAYFAQAVFPLGVPANEPKIFIRKRSFSVGVKGGPGGCHGVAKLTSFLDRSTGYSPVFQFFWPLGSYSLMVQTKVVVQKGSKQG